FLVGESPEDEKLIQTLVLVEQHYRLFTLLTFDSTIAKVCFGLTNESTKMVPVTEPAKVLLDAGEEIPCDLMAKVLKFLLLQIKTTDQQRRVAEQVRENPQLIGVLDAIGVHVANVIKICSKHTHRSEVQQEEHAPEGNEQTQTASPVVDAGEWLSVVELAAQTRRLDLFWSGLSPVLDNARFDSKLHNVAQLSYTVPDLLLSFQTLIPEDVANLIYDCLDWRRQHQHYLERLRKVLYATVIRVKSKLTLSVLMCFLCQVFSTLHNRNQRSFLLTEVDLHPVTTHVDMRYYSSLLDLVPPEASSVPLILHCMLEQVCCFQLTNDVTIVFEAMPLTRLDKDGGLLKTAGPLGTLEPAEQHPPTIIPWDNPLSYAKQQLHNLQTKGAASDEYRCLDTFRGSHNNILYIFCHNPMSPQRQCKEFWDAALHTDVRFRSELYLEHVADTISDWTREEELKKEEKQQLSNRSLAESPEGTVAVSCLLSARYRTVPDLYQNVGRTLNLQAWKMEQERLKEEEMTKKSKKENTPKVKQPEEDKKSRTMSGGKKSRAETAASSAKTAVERNQQQVTADDKVIPQCVCVFDVQGFIGYRMDGKLIHVSGRLQCLFPSDGGLITVENVSYVKGIKKLQIFRGLQVNTSSYFQITTRKYHQSFVCSGVCSEEQGMLVRQSFPLHGSGERRQLQDPSLSKEMSRIVTSQGTVIRYMRDGSAEVQMQTLSVLDVLCVCTEQSFEKQANAQRGCWSTTTPSGARICTVGTTHERIPTSPLLTFKATDPITHQVMLSREDLVVSVQNPDGSVSVEHADGTRITSLCQDRPPDTTHHMLRQTGDQQAVHTHSKRVVMVEKEGCATVVMYPERHTAHVFLADRTVITGNNRGAFQVLPSSVGILQIQSDGKCVYSSDSLVTPSPKGSAPTNPPGSYTMSHTDSVACDVTDPDGNHFQVSYLPAPSTLTHEEEEQDGDMAGLHELETVFMDILCSRLFLVHADGSGTELLSSQTVEELLYQAHCDPTIALLKEPLPDTQDEFGITILKPSEESVWSKWVLEKQSPDITPPNLRNRSWHDFPRAEKKIPGPPFGTDLGRGLTITERSCGSAVQHPPVRSCPKVLEMRELFQHRCQLSLIFCLAAAVSYWDQNSIRHSCAARRRAQGEMLCESGKLWHYHHKHREFAAVAAEFLLMHVSFRQDLCDDKACWEALRKKNIVPYFHPENVPIYQVVYCIMCPNTNYTVDCCVCVCVCVCVLPAESIRRGGTSGPCKSLQLDVTGQPRRTKVRLPASILRSKPCSVPNQQVHRRLLKCSLVVARGFQLLPSRADFGTLREGTSTAITVLMVNVGVDTCRFHVKQPPPATGLQVIYNPGPVAAGLQVQLQVQLFATCAAQSGDEEPRKHVSHDIIIHTETDILYLPVTANILSARRQMFCCGRDFSEAF
uniref:Sperm associated antigen 17 n=1 Tax=Mastacembelus armatus TaxID=205130 RepID=A0A3Q3LHS1_9TELE